MLMVTGEVLSHKKYGEPYHALTIVAPDIGERIRPGQFVNIKCGTNRDHILRRPFSVYRVHKRGGWASTIEIVFDLRGAGTEYLSLLRGHSTVDLVGPLGRGFALPKRRAHCLLVGGGIGATPLFFLADELRNEGHRVDFVLGARSSGLLLNPIEARRVASVCAITTDDGSQGDKGRVTDVLAQTLDRCDTEVVYACGPHPMLAAVSRVCVEKKIPVQVAVEELMGCGYGVCMTCVMPLQKPAKKEGSRLSSRPNTDEEDQVVYARSCTEGPVFNGAVVMWNGAAGDSALAEPVAVAQARSLIPEPIDEYAPPGN
jgi:dihydroorotate dehydrogenase electron transfer subunit